MPVFRATDGAALHYDELGGNSAAGPPLVVLAGGAARHPSYLGDLAGLAARCRLIVPHLRGVGNSPPPAAGQAELGSFWRQAEDVESLRAALGLERVLLAGHSAGTRLAVAYAAQFPGRLAGLLLISPPAGWLVDEPSDADAHIGRRRGEPAFDAALAAWQAGPEGAGDAAFNAWEQVVAPFGYAAWASAEREHAAAGRYYRPAAEAFFSVDPPGDLPARLAKVSAPVTVLAGAQDCVTGLAPVLAVARLFPAGQAVVIDRCGHFPWVEQPAAFLEAAETFLAGCPARTS